MTETPDLNRVAEWNEEEMQAYVSGFAIKPKHAAESVGFNRSNTYCERCGGANGAIIYGGSRKCDCSKRFGAAHAALRRVDLAGEMTFDSLADPHPSVADAAQKLRAVSTGKRKHGLFMFGLPGRGKTHLSVSTARALLDRGVLVGAYSLAGLVGRIQDTYGYDDALESRGKIVADVCANEVVILDDVGKEHRSSNVESIIYEIVDGLYNAQITLIASSNLPGKEFVERYDGAVLSRLGGMCEKVVIKGDDQRAKRWDW